MNQASSPKRTYVAIAMAPTISAVSKAMSVIARVENRNARTRIISVLDPVQTLRRFGHVVVALVTGGVCRLGPRRRVIEDDARDAISADDVRSPLHQIV